MNYQVHTGKTRKWQYLFASTLVHLKPLPYLKPYNPADPPADPLYCIAMDAGAFGGFRSTSYSSSLLMLALDCRQNSKANI